MRVYLDRDPFASQGLWDDQPDWARGRWPVRWIHNPDGEQTPSCDAYRLRFDVRDETTADVHVTADERYDLYLDGQYIATGSQRGDWRNWFFETYRLELTAGSHVLVARTWAYGEFRPHAQFTVRPGFLLAAQGELGQTLSTGSGAWEVKSIQGLEIEPQGYRSVGEGCVIDGRLWAWGHEAGQGQGWGEVLTGSKGISAEGCCCASATGPWLRPATLPPMLRQGAGGGQVRFAAPLGEDPASTPVREAQSDTDAEQRWQQMLDGEAPMEVPAGGRMRAIIDLEEYYCGYPRLTVSGGANANVRIAWAESLYTGPKGQEKGHRSEIEGKYFRGRGDTFILDGGDSRVYQPLWWQAGRYLQISVEAGDEPVSLDSLEILETHYPLSINSQLACDGDDRLAAAMPVLRRGLLMCMHETYMDCPYYEQLMYVGDTRLQVLTTYALSGDDRLPRHAIRMFRESILPTGLTRSNYPSHGIQVIPPFSLWWIGMVHDYALWRQDGRFVRDMLPGVRGVLNAFLTGKRDDGQVANPPGWNFVDWAATWKIGVPPGGKPGLTCAPVQWQLVLGLLYAAKLEQWHGDLVEAGRWQREAEQLAGAIREHFWDEQRNCFADDADHTRFGEHSQALALLSGLLDNDRRAGALAQLIRPDEDLATASIYFSHYVLEALAVHKQIEPLFDRLELWRALPEKGFKTTYETPLPTRSDCHAWGAHPLYRFYATILGVTPARPGYSAVRIEPQLGPLPAARGRLVHPLGIIDVDLTRDGEELHGAITLPTGLGGELITGGECKGLKSGRTTF